MLGTNESFRSLVETDNPSCQLPLQSLIGERVRRADVSTLTLVEEIPPGHLPSLSQGLRSPVACNMNLNIYLSLRILGASNERV